MGRGGVIGVAIRVRVLSRRWALVPEGVEVDDLVSQSLLVVWIHCHCCLEF